MTTFAEGKTKRIIEGPKPHTVLLQAVNRLTGGDAARVAEIDEIGVFKTCLLYTSPSPRDKRQSRMPSSA